MYKCEVCTACSRPGQPRLLHTIHRKVSGVRNMVVNRPNGSAFAKHQLLEDCLREEVAREIPVCLACHQSLAGGESINVLWRKWANARLASEPTAPTPGTPQLHLPSMKQPEPIIEPVVVRPYAVKRVAIGS